MEICSCGHQHCCHKVTIKRLIETKNEVGRPYKFIRETCEDCGRWIGDKLIQS
jgi:hypothetical protein